VNAALKHRVDVLSALGQKLEEQIDDIRPFIHRSQRDNPWFIPALYEHRIQSVLQTYFNEEHIHSFLENYNITDKESKRIGLIMAGNIPLVGIQDMIHVYLSGHHAEIKLSTKDRYVLPEIISWWNAAHGEDVFHIVPRLQQYDAVIATGSDQAIRTFQQYFENVPHVLRGHRNGVAVLNSQETEEDIKALANDVFTYFGLGCRNVSKIYVPQGYDFAPLVHGLKAPDIVKHNGKYRNNYEYSLAMLTMNNVLHVNNCDLLFFEHSSLHSKVATLHFEYYNDMNQLQDLLLSKKDQIQCVISNMDMQKMDAIGFGAAQYPALGDYADQTDIMNTLNNWFDAED